MFERFIRTAKTSTRSSRGKKWESGFLRKLKPFSRANKGARRKKSGLGRFFGLGR